VPTAVASHTVDTEGRLTDNSGESSAVTAGISNGFSILTIPQNSNCLFSYLSVVSALPFIMVENNSADSACALRLISSRFLFLALLFCFTLPGLAQEEPEELDSDRSTQSQGPAVLPQGTFQTETGVMYVHDRQEGNVMQAFSDPNLMVRIGLLKGLELRLSGKYLDSTIENEASGIQRKVHGIAAPVLGFKAQFSEAKGWWPAIGLLGQVTLPLGSKEIRPKHASPSGRLLFEHELGEKWEVLYNLAYTWKTNEQHGEEGYVFTLQYRLSKPVKVFTEVFGTKDGEGPAEHLANAGLMWEILPILQFDVSAGRRLNPSAPDYYLNGGLTLRLPH
jgi:hypothetical protein